MEHVEKIPAYFTNVFSGNGRKLFNQVEPHKQAAIAIKVGAVAYSMARLSAATGIGSPLLFALASGYLAYGRETMMENIIHAGTVEEMVSQVFSVLEGVYEGVKRQFPSILSDRNIEVGKKVGMAALGARFIASLLPLISPGHAMILGGGAMLYSEVRHQPIIADLERRAADAYHNVVGVPVEV